MIDFSKKIGIKPKAKQVDPVEIYNGLDRIRQMRVLYDQFKNEF